MNLEFSIQTKNERVYKSFLNDWLTELLKVLLKERSVKNRNRLKASEIGLVFVSSQKIKKLNKDYRKIDRETDVLSFDGDGFVSIGELIFSMKMIKKKARDSKLPIKCYLALLMTHGFLHLLGYEHEVSEVEEAEMFKLQDKIMRKVAAKLAPKYKNDFDVA